MNEQEIRRATAAGINDAVGGILKGAFVALCVVAAFAHPTPWLLLGAVFAPVWAALSSNRIVSWIGCLILKLAFYTLVFAVAVWVIPYFVGQH